MRGSTGRCRDWTPYAFVGPALILLIGVNVFPLLYSIALSFTNVDLVGGAWKFVGGFNYAVAFKFAQYGAALRTTAPLCLRGRGCGTGLGLCLGAGA